LQPSELLLKTEQDFQVQLQSRFYFPAELEWRLNIVLSKLHPTIYALSDVALFWHNPGPNSQRVSVAAAL
jgi:hypothetical protein